MSKTSQLPTCPFALVVDEELHIRSLLSLLFEDFAIPCQIPTDPIEAYETLLTSNEVAVVVLSLDMPQKELDLFLDHLSGLSATARPAVIGLASPPLPDTLPAVDHLVRKPIHGRSFLELVRASLQTVRKPSS